MNRSKINYGKQYVDSDDIRVVTKVLKSDWLTQGPKIEEFENRLKNYFGSKYCTVLSNGTGALHLAGLALGWSTGDIILSSPISFLSSSNCIIYTGAKPDFVDIDEKTYTIDPNKVEEKIKYYFSKKKKVKAIIATDFAGNSCDWESLKKISNMYGVKLVNDNCHALGTRLNNNHKYAIKYADIVTQSYHPVKHITTGEGGSVLTDDKTIDQKVRMLRSHGVIKNSRSMTTNDGPWYYEMHELGFNYRITDFQCALGISQLKSLNKFLKRRREIAKIYDTEFNNNNIFVTPKSSKNCNHSYHLYPLQINFDKIKISKKELFKKIKEKRISLQVHYIPIHLQPYYRQKYGFESGNFPVAEKFYSREVSLPMYFSLKNKQIYKVTKLIKKYCAKKL